MSRKRKVHSITHIFHKHTLVDLTESETRQQFSRTITGLHHKRHNVRIVFGRNHSAKRPHQQTREPLATLLFAGVQHSDALEFVHQHPRYRLPIASLLRSIIRLEKSDTAVQFDVAANEHFRTRIAQRPRRIDVFGVRIGIERPYG